MTATPLTLTDGLTQLSEVVDSEPVTGADEIFDLDTDSMRTLCD